MMTHSLLINRIRSKEMNEKSELEQYAESLKEGYIKLKEALEEIIEIQEQVNKVNPQDKWRQQEHLKLTIERTKTLLGG
jgi:hypothetical protein